MSGPISRKVDALKLEQGALKSEIHQLKDIVQQLVNRFDARDILQQRTLFRESYGMHVQTTRGDGKPGFVAETNGGAKGEYLTGHKGIGITPYDALRDLADVIERKKAMHVHGRTE